MTALIHLRRRKINKNNIKSIQKKNMKTITTLNINDKEA